MTTEVTTESGKPGHVERARTSFAVVGAARAKAAERANARSRQHVPVDVPAHVACLCGKPWPCSL